MPKKIGSLDSEMADAYSLVNQVADTKLRQQWRDSVDKLVTEITFCEDNIQTEAARAERRALRLVIKQIKAFVLEMGS